VLPGLNTFAAPSLAFVSFVRFVAPIPSWLRAVPSCPSCASWPWVSSWPRSLARRKPSPRTCPRMRREPSCASCASWPQYLRGSEPCLRVLRALRGRESLRGPVSRPWQSARPGEAHGRQHTTADVL